MHGPDLKSVRHSSIRSIHRTLSCDDTTTGTWLSPAGGVRSVMPKEYSPMAVACYGPFPLWLYRTSSAHGSSPPTSITGRWSNIERSRGTPKRLLQPTTFSMEDGTRFKKDLTILPSREHHRWQQTSMIHNINMLYLHDCSADHTLK